MQSAVRAATDSANELVDLLQTATNGGPTGMRPDRGLAQLLEACRSSWPVEGGDASEVRRSAALLLVLRRIHIRCGRAGGSEWDRLSGGGEGPKCLAELAIAAETLPAVDEVLRSLEQRLPRGLPEALTVIAQATDATLPLAVFYEQLLARFDRRQRLARGVFHTPASVATWMVRAVYQLARSQFGPADRLRFIDMGCGCGTFLSEAMRQWQPTLQSMAGHASFVGYEVVPATYAMANWLLGSGDCSGRVNCQIHWTNPLLSGEVERLRILQPDSLPILIGNPPYANFGRGNRGPWIDGLLRDYKNGLGERKANLDDDFIKFIRWGQHWVDSAGGGILAVVTSRTYLAGLTHRHMRRSLLDSFDRAYILDLHGDRSAEDDAVDSDENVFNVRSGVAIGLFVKTGRSPGSFEGRYHSIRGPRSTKLAWLRGMHWDQVPWRQTNPEPPAYSFMDRPPGASRQSRLYESNWPLTRIFRQWISGVQTKNDKLFVDFDREVLAERIKRWLQSSNSAANPTFDERFIQPYLLAPFDRRWIYYDRSLLGRARFEVMRHMLQPNVGLVFMRQSTNDGEYDHFLAVDCLVSDRIFYSRHGAPYLAPLWTYANETGEERSQNVSDEWLAACTAQIRAEPDAEALFDYIYAVVHHTSYRRTFASELRQGFPRIPLPASTAQFKTLVALGRRLRHLHTASGAPEVPEEDCASSTSRIGGYDVIQRWKKPRVGRSISEEAKCEQRIKRILQETARLRSELDSLHLSIN